MVRVEALHTEHDKLLICDRLPRWRMARGHSTVAEKKQSKGGKIVPTVNVLLARVSSC